MTEQEKREKVIKGLEHEVARANAGVVELDFVDCVEVSLLHDALTLLKAQPCEDWISRKRLKNEIQYYIEEAGWGKEVNKVLGWCLEFIDNQEAVKWDD